MSVRKIGLSMFFFLPNWNACETTYQPGRLQLVTIVEKDWLAIFSAVWEVEILSKVYSKSLDDTIREVAVPILGLRVSSRRVLPYDQFLEPRWLQHRVLNSEV